VMTKMDDLNYSITLQGANTGQKYKYCSGPNWNYVELNADNSQVSNRNYTPNDVVAKWTAVYDPSIVPYYLSYNVTVPTGTKNCYIAGEMNNFSFQAMNRVDNTHFSITILSHSAYGYKYLSGPDWTYEERNADGSTLSNRTYAVNDVVAQWAAIFDPSALTAADYYLPLNTGNYSLLHTSLIPNGSSWGSRNTFYSFIRTESINGVQYVVEQGKDIMDNNPSQMNVFRVFWLRKDDSGNIVAGAYSLSNDDNLATAVILPTPAMIIPNQFLTLNYSQTYPTSGNMIKTDSVVSISANAGSYTNCIQVRTKVKTNGIITLIEDSYYAYHVGIVMINRLYPASEAHTDILINYQGNVVTGTKEIMYNNPFVLYPNPFIDGFYISPGVNANSISVYNLSGVLVFSKTISGTNYINISGLSKGMYIVRITTNEGMIEKKLIKR